MSIEQPARRPAPIGIIVVLVLATLFYAIMMAALGDLQNAGNDAMGRGFAAAFAIFFGFVLWILLGSALLIGGIRGEMPDWSGIAGTVLLPLSAIAAVTAESYLEDRVSSLYMLVPALIPPMTAAYALWARLPGLHRVLLPLPTSIVAWGAVALLTLMPLPRYVAEQQARHAQFEEEKKAAEQEAAKAEEEHRKNLERFQKLTGDSPLWEWAEFFGKNSDFDEQAIAGANKLSHLQADAEEALRRGMGFPLVEYTKLDIRATPALCTAAAEFLTQDADAHKAPNDEADYQTVQDYFEPYDESIEWLTQSNCDLDGAVARIRAAVGGYQQSGSRDAYLAVLAWRRGNGFFKRNDLDRALAEYSEAIRIRPDTEQFFGSRGDVYNDKHDYDRAIADFDEAIRLNPGYSSAFNDRAMAYFDKGDEDRALQDLDAAIAMRPEFALAYDNRADIFVHKGELARAIEDFNKALDIAPKYRTAFAGRGRVKFYQASYPEAATDLAAALELKKDDPYTVLWLYLARARAGQNARDALPADAAKLDRAAWPYPIVAALLGDADAQTVLAGASRDGNPDRQGQECEADFYFGAKAAAEGDNAAARPMLQHAAADCPTDYIERVGAGYELATLP